MFRINMAMTSVRSFINAKADLTFIPEKPKSQRAFTRITLPRIRLGSLDGWTKVVKRVFLFYLRDKRHVSQGLLLDMDGRRHCLSDRLKNETKIWNEEAYGETIGIMVTNSSHLKRKLPFTELTQIL